MNIKKLYDDLIMEHIKNVRNFREPKKFTDTSTGVNHLCGDSLKVFVDMNNEIINDVAFKCECCGISMASASMMTELIRGESKKKATEYLDDFIFFLEHGQNRNELILKDLKDVLGIVSAFPSRKNCASLGWVTLKAALEGKKETLL